MVGRCALQEKRAEKNGKKVVLKLKSKKEK
jgi:hypothetical protein